jgi:aminoethylphosphonate catabolism LysR family transcriptional regulator
MRYVQLRAFHNVAVHGGFSRAAEALHLTQPAISDQVRKLEAEYDIRLFDRQRKQIRVTDAGKKLLEITYRLFEVEQQALDYLCETQTLRTGQLNIVADAAHHILHVLTPFRRANPGVFISVHGGNTETAIERLQSYEADIGVVGDVPANREFETIRLNSSPIVAFTARGGPLAKLSTMTFKELMRHPLVLRETGSKTRAKLEEEAKRQGIRITGSIEAEGREAVREIVAAGGGVGVVSEAEFGQDTRLVKIPISDSAMTMDESIICLRERLESKVIRAFMSAAHAEMKS